MGLLNNGFSLEAVKETKPSKEMMARKTVGRQEHIMRKTKQELQFIIDRISTTWGIMCYLLGMDENSIICMSHEEEVQIMDERNLELLRREGS